uniref:Uncharacterized protein n=1 Tax=Anguilla anguilla TaxID=7936 RepID=A0A0E9PJP4_ANGAN
MRADGTLCACAGKTGGVARAG